jgi:DNA-binding NtrC family response regulator
MFSLILKVPHVTGAQFTKLAAFLASDKNRIPREKELPLVKLMAVKPSHREDARYNLTLSVERHYQEASGTCYPIPAEDLQGLWDALELFPVADSVSSSATADSEVCPLSEVVADRFLLKEVVAEAEKFAIGRALKKCGGRKAEAAALLGISRKQLWEKMKGYGLDDEG